MPKVNLFLSFDAQAEEAATLYTSVFPNSRIVEVARYGSAGPGPEGAVMTVGFELDGQRFVALDGGPEYTLSGGGEEGPCGWSKDRFGVSWQVVPTRLTEPERAAS